MSIGTFLFVLMFQFQNCAQDSTPNVQEDIGSSFACSEADCIPETAANLKISPNLFNGNVVVKTGIDEFNLGGDCNEGGFPDTVVHWALVLNNVTVRNSDQGLVAGAPVNVKCVNGRFNAYITLRAVAGIDNVDRTGLKIGSSTATSQYTLKLSIKGKRADGTTDAGNLLDTVQSINLVPGT
jgi:hypothetical protein